MHEAKFYTKLGAQKVGCLLCPHQCIIPEGKFGFCSVRKNTLGILYSEIYGKITSLALDPIEKKPLYHYHPKEYILSIGTRGCNLKCQFCQNWTISQNPKIQTQDTSSDFLIQSAKSNNSFGIAYTYNEPFIWYEFVYDTARLAKKEGLENVLVTNGYVNLAPLKELLPFIDAMNIDLKSIEDSFYARFCSGQLNPVLEAIKESKKTCHIELTNLVITTLNDKDDNFTKLVDWIYQNLGQDVPLHFSRYFPCYKMDLPPTPLETLERAYGIAKKKLKYVYLGNV